MRNYQGVFAERETLAEAKAAGIYNSREPRIASADLTYG
jgi:hypothetical protein